MTRCNETNLCNGNDDEDGNGSEEGGGSAILIEGKDSGASPGGASLFIILGGLSTLRLRQRSLTF